MPRLRLVFIAVALIICGGFYRGAFFPPSNVAFVQDDGTQVVNSSNVFTTVADRTLAGATYKLICQGDSLTAVSVQAPGYCVDSVGLLSSGRSITATWKPIGMIGYSWNYNYPSGPWIAQTINSEAPSQVDTEIYPGLTNVLIMWAGTNGIYLGGHTGAQEYSDFQAAFAGHVAAGWPANKIVVITTLPRQDSASFETQRLIYNADLISFCSANGCLIADAGGDATIGCSGCEDNTTYYQPGGIHLNATGDTYLATNLIYPQLP